MSATHSPQFASAGREDPEAQRDRGHLPSRAVLRGPLSGTPPRQVCTRDIFTCDLAQPYTLLLLSLWYKRLGTSLSAPSSVQSSLIYLYHVFLSFRSLVTVEGVTHDSPVLSHAHTLPVTRSHLSEDPRSVHLWLESISFPSSAPSPEAGKGRWSPASAFSSLTHHHSAAG